MGEANPNEKGDFLKGQVIEQDTSTSLLVLVGIFFPSVTGILAGCNRSGDLADPSRSIPKGTLIAQTGTSIVYIASVLAYGASVDRLALRDKSGLGLQNKLVSAKLAWPHEWFVLVGSFFSTSGAALQSLVSAPRLLNAIASDEVIPFLRFLGVKWRGEPVRALCVTLIIAELGVLVADIDKLTPLVSMLFLLCYTFINFSCAFQSLMAAPNWRPRFKCYHWLLSCLGAFVCLSVMFIASPIYAAVAWLLFVVLYVYIYFKG
jgi:solute carrier family 12 (potassium/chloride transporter), member 4/6